MATRTLGVALWEYRNHDGRRRRAYYRQTFELPDDEVERGERAGVFAPEPPEPDRPAKGSTNPVLVEWLVEHGADRADVEGLTKAELWQCVDDVDDVEIVTAQQD